MTFISKILGRPAVHPWWNFGCPSHSGWSGILVVFVGYFDVNGQWTTQMGIWVAQTIIRSPGATGQPNICYIVAVNFMVQDNSDLQLGQNVDKM